MNLLLCIVESFHYAKNEANIEYVFLTTNGFLATPERIVSLVNSGLDSLKFSINAATKEKYQEMHGVNAFDKVIENVKWAGNFKKTKNKSIKISVSSIYVEKNIQELLSMKESLMPYLDDFYFLPLYNQSGHVGEKNYSKFVGNPGRYDNLVPPIPCWELFNAAKISWNGWMTACCFDHDRKFEIANLNETSLMQAWSHQKFVELRKKHLSNDNNVLKKSLCAKCLGL